MIAIVDYGMGNLASVRNAFWSIGEREVRISGDADEIRRADGILLPGVGAFGDAMKNLNRAGLVQAIQEKVSAGVPFLGICLGYHLIFEESEEGGSCEGLGLLRGRVIRFEVDAPVPHMGWNTAHFLRSEGIFDSFKEDVYFYFDHAYYPDLLDSEVIAAETDYGQSFVSAVLKENIMGTQFHPEKSHRNGLKIIQNFANRVKGFKEQGFPIC